MEESKSIWNKTTVELTVGDMTKVYAAVVVAIALPKIVSAYLSTRGTKFKPE